MRDAAVLIDSPGSTLDIRPAMPPEAGSPASRLLEAAQAALDGGRLVAARALLEAGRRLQTDAQAGDAQAADRLDLLDGKLLLGEGQAAAAVALLARAVDRSSDNWRLRCLAADARLATDDAAGAAAEAAEAVLRAPGEVAPKAALGIALTSLGRLRDAVSCLAEAVRNQPHIVRYRLALAHAQYVGGDMEAARATLLDGLAKAPLAHPWRAAAIRLAFDAHDYPAALALADVVYEQGLAEADTLALRAHALSCLGRDEEAGAGYYEALKAEPESGYLRHLAASSGWVAAPLRTSPDYVRTVFDGFAGHFESDLERFDYCGPALMRAAVLPHLPHGWTEDRVGGKTAEPAAAGAPGRLAGYPSVLDIGCGTGLVAARLHDLPLGIWTGVDISGAMLREAAAKELYTNLIEGDCCDETVMEQLLKYGLFGLAIAADVLPYFGDPVPLLAAAAQLLAPRGLFVLTAEADARPEAPAFRLGPRARFVHQPDHLIAAAGRLGLRTLSCWMHPLRKDRGGDVPACILALAHESSPHSLVQRPS